MDADKPPLGQQVPQSERRGLLRCELKGACSLGIHIQLKKGGPTSICSRIDEVGMEGINTT